MSQVEIDWNEPLPPGSTAGTVRDAITEILQGFIPNLLKELRDEVTSQTLIGIASVCTGAAEHHPADYTRDQVEAHQHALRGIAEACLHGSAKIGRPGDGFPFPSLLDP
jgi:hypothetical protein